MTRRGQAAAGPQPADRRRFRGPREALTREKRLGIPNQWAVRGFLLAEILIFLVLVSIHFNLLGGDRGQAAGTTESVIVAVLVLGLLLTWTPPPWSERATTAAQSFGTLGVLVGLLTIALGIRPRTILDLSLNVVLLATLIAGLASQRRARRRGTPAGQLG